MEYKDGELEAVYHEEGRVAYENNESRYEYNLKDHLGNVRVVFSDLNGNGYGYVEPFSYDPNAPTPAPGTPVTYTEILQENQYYPFGMKMEGPWQETTAAPSNKYTYNGKEFNDDFDLGWHDYGARMYDASIGRWNAVDFLAENYSNITPYAYAVNNPIKFIDPDGMRVSLFDRMEEQGMRFGRTADEAVGELGNGSRETNTAKSSESKSPDSDKLVYRTYYYSLLEEITTTKSVVDEENDSPSNLGFPPRKNVTETTYNEVASVFIIIGFDPKSGDVISVDDLPNSTSKDIIFEVNAEIVAKNTVHAKITITGEEVSTGVEGSLQAGGIVSASGTKTKSSTKYPDIYNGLRIYEFDPKTMKSTKRNKFLNLITTIQINNKNYRLRIFDFDWFAPR